MNETELPLHELRRWAEAFTDNPDTEDYPYAMRLIALIDERLHPIERAWNYLPEAEREHLERTLTLKQLRVYKAWLAGLPFETMASAFGVSVRTVRTHLARARQVHDRITQEAA